MTTIYKFVRDVVATIGKRPLSKWVLKSIKLADKYNVTDYAITDDYIILWFNDLRVTLYNNRSPIYHVTYHIINKRDWYAQLAMQEYCKL